MGFVCSVKKEMVQNQRRILVPSKIRKVTYEGYHKIRNRDGTESMLFDSSSTGWEIMQEIPVCEKLYPEFIQTFKAEEVATKVVRFIKPRPPLKKFTKNRDDDDKLEE